MHHNLATKALCTCLEAEQAKATLGIREWNRQEPLTLIQVQTIARFVSRNSTRHEPWLPAMLPYIHEGFFADPEEPEAHFRGQPASSLFEMQLQLDRTTRKEFLS